MDAIPDAVAMLTNPEKVDIKTVGESPKLVESPKAEPPKVEPPKEQISPQLARLAQEKKKFEEEKKKWEQERTGADWKAYEEYKAFKANPRANALKILESHGLSYDELTEEMLTGKPPKDSAVKTLEEKLEKMEKERLSKEEQAKKDLEAYQLEQFKSKIKEDVLAKGDEFELINGYGVHNSVYKKIQDHYDETQEVLSTLEAAKLVESHLEEETKKYTSLKKLKALFGTQEPPKPKTDDEVEPKAPVTLSNNGSSSTTSTEEEDYNDPKALLRKASALLAR